jgi:hypothetical protein
MVATFYNLCLKQPCILILDKIYYKYNNLTLMCGLTIEFYLDLRIKINLEQGKVNLNAKVHNFDQKPW